MSPAKASSRSYVPVYQSTNRRQGIGEVRRLPGLTVKQIFIVISRTIWHIFRERVPSWPLNSMLAGRDRTKTRGNNWYFSTSCLREKTRAGAGRKQIRRSGNRSKALFHLRYESQSQMLSIITSVRRHRHAVASCSNRCVLDTCCLTVLQCARSG